MLAEEGGRLLERVGRLWRQGHLLARRGAGRLCDDRECRVPQEEGRSQHRHSLSQRLRPGHAAAADAEGIEHHVSDKTLTKMSKFNSKKNI